MHALINMILKNEPTGEEIAEKMAPYDEAALFGYDEEKEESIEPDVWPQFHWDYYQDWRITEIPISEAGECFTIMDPEGYVLSRQWYDGHKGIDQKKKFERYIEKEMPKWTQEGYRCFRMDYHW